MSLPAPIRSFKQYQALHPEKKVVDSPKPVEKPINPDVHKHLTSIEVKETKVTDSKTSGSNSYMMEFFAIFVIFLVVIHYFRKRNREEKEK
ncbi:hypothetical protein [Galenea microaerophila]